MVHLPDQDLVCAELDVLGTELPSLSVRIWLCGLWVVSSTGPECLGLAEDVFIPSGAGGRKHKFWFAGGLVRPRQPSLSQFRSTFSFRRRSAARHREKPGLTGRVPAPSLAQCGHQEQPSAAFSVKVRHVVLVKLLRDWWPRVGIPDFNEHPYGVAGQLQTYGCGWTPSNRRFHGIGNEFGHEEFDRLSYVLKSPLSDYQSSVKPGTRYRTRGIAPSSK